MASLRWVIAHRAVTPWFLVRYWRFARLRLRHPEVIVLGLVFLDRRVVVEARPGYGRLILGPWVHIGADTALRCHEGTLRIGDRTIIGRGVSINCYLDVEIGSAGMVADHVYIADFDHRFDDLTRPVKDQGLAMGRVRLGHDVWLGTKVSVMRGTTIGDSAVVGANSVVSRDIPARCVAVGSPARVIRRRDIGAG
jgi:acetyltransferase-like isoleucine patch superfamily enzyme